MLGDLQYVQQHATPQEIAALLKEHKTISAFPVVNNDGIN